MSAATADSKSRGVNERPGVQLFMDLTPCPGQPGDERRRAWLASYFGFRSTDARRLGKPAGFHPAVSRRIPDGGDVLSTPAARTRPAVFVLYSGRQRHAACHEPWPGGWDACQCRVPPTLHAAP